jgi:PEP-CTERM motif
MAWFLLFPHWMSIRMHEPTPWTGRRSTAALSIVQGVLKTMKHIRPTLSLACLLLSASALQASPILPGHLVVPEAMPYPSGDVTILDVTDGAFSFGSGPNLLSGSFLNAVMIDPFGLTCATCLDFLYAVQLDDDVRGGIVDLSPGLFTGFDTSVAYVSDTGIVPLDTFRGPGGGAYLDFTFVQPGNFSNYIHPGEASSYLIVATNATSYDRSGTLGVVGFSGPYNKPVLGGVTELFAPVAVPEPDSLGLLGAGVIGLLLVSLRRKTVTPHS